MKKNLAFLVLIAALLSACAGTNPTLSLSDTTWDLISYGPTDNLISAVQDVEATISFDADGNLNGNVGCNGFGGSYEVSGSKLTTGPLMSTMMACETLVMDQEYAVLMLLNGTLRLEADGDRLTIFSENGKSAMNLIRTEN